MKVESPCILFSTLLFNVVAVFADWQYRSRPDLAAPILNITKEESESTRAPGYVFIAPYSGDVDANPAKLPRQPAPYIFKDNGELIWSGFSYFSIWAANFQAGKLNGEDILFSFEGSHNPSYGHGHGHVTILNQNYETVKEIRAGNHRIADKHEFHITDDQTGLIEIYHPVPRYLNEYGATEEQQWIIDAKFQELNLTTGEVLFEWSSLEHVSPSESVLPINIGEAGSGYGSSDAWDYFHINSVDKDGNGDYLISSRDTASIYKIDGRTGEILWKLGGLPGVTTSDFESDIDLTFSFQHHARYLSTLHDSTKQVISFFDNSAHGSEDDDKYAIKNQKSSSAKIIEVDIKNWRVRLLFNGIAPDNLLAKSQGSTQVLPDGNVFVNWGSEGAITEFTKNEEVVFHAYLDSDYNQNVQNYRAFKFNWTGIPNEKIATFAENTAEGSTNIYVSWNGDTRTSKWKFYLLNDKNDKQFIGESIRNGFETIFNAERKVHGEIVAEAYDFNETLLAASDPVSPEEEVRPYPQNRNTLNQDASIASQSYFSWKKLQHDLVI